MSTTPYSPELIASLETALHGHTGRHVPAIDCLNPLFTLLLVVGYALLVYDHILTFTDEVQFIWKAKRSPVVIMFLLNRYITPIVLAIDLYDKAGIATYASHRFCVTWYFTEAMWYIVSFGMTHALVAMRASSIHILRMLCKYTNSFGWHIFVQHLGFYLLRSLPKLTLFILSHYSKYATSLLHPFSTPGGGLQMQISADEVELSGVTLSSKVHGQELEAGTPTGLSPSRSTFK
ncbi:transmembrane protein, putative, partial [Rhizoctonia solani AG-3 Rhs1AP]